MNDLLVLLVLVLTPIFLIGTPIFLVRSVIANHSLSKQRDLDFHQDFLDTLQKHKVVSYEVIVDRVQRVAGPGPDGHVYRILYDSNGQYYLYLFHSGTPGVLKPLTKERALFAAGTSGHFKV